MVGVTTTPHARRWGPGTAAIVRLLVAADAPLTQVAIAEAVGVTQPRASQVLKRLSADKAVTVSVHGYRGKRGRLIDLYGQYARPHLVMPESYWFSTRALADQARRMERAARQADVRVACSADLAPDLLVPWRHPTLAIVYVDGQLELEAAGLVPAEGRADATMLVRWTDDTTLLTANQPWPAAVDKIPLADPVQQWWDLRDLGGEDRREAADRLRRAIISKSIAAAA
ncbi:MAG: hypothetical protein ACT4OX_10675 [Actinomycetota bacterium]